MHSGAICMTKHHLGKTNISNGQYSKNSSGHEIQGHHYSFTPAPSCNDPANVPDIIFYKLTATINSAIKPYTL